MMLTKTAALILFATNVATAQNGPPTCTEEGITTCTRGAVGACDMACSEDEGAKVKPPCQTKCNGRPGGNVGGCFITKDGETVFQCVNPRLNGEPDFLEVVVDTPADESEGVDVTTTKSIIGLLRGIANYN
mmetsp:Transcript_23028/g.48562  ORF Transcript_23028/g.48562 Transcript_23028/m.48562 type:complete len:131 (-) Transcript_23028:103-495(-)|eukprot:CAMPEP_0184405392 /NCGR_PEP_ID=MMETSP0738-20130409/659_1 /TAXON_ID=385413 /ORGANISM="Thalassiosira miniscula, Strain CCMP1093" /LENGTH=130 /DNA_ID=CAMNT_0026761847 /DNA_START=67 /DNA_END=459 /DNA_ORIENTATION=-